MVDPDRRDRDTEHTTVVERDGGGGGGVLAIVLLVIVVLVLLWVFREQLGFTNADTGSRSTCPSRSTSTSIRAEYGGERAAPYRRPSASRAVGESRA
jgi:hypothetical protein